MYPAAVMGSHPGAFTELRERLAEISDLAVVSELLGWDQQTMMPPRGSEVRAEQLATLGKILHEKSIDDGLGRLYEQLRPYEESLEPDSFEASLIRVGRRDWEKARRVPSELEEELARTCSISEHAWVDARARSDFYSFLPHLEKVVELKRRYVECFPDVEEPYDALLDDFEPGMKTAEARAALEELKRGIVPIVAGVADSPASDYRERFPGDYPLASQHELVAEMLTPLGYDPEAWRIDETAHPFASRGGTQDIRLTTRYHHENLSSIFSSLHECGHGMYEHGVDPALERTPLGGGVSMSLHESQSRMIENVVGRSLPFWTHWFGRTKELFPEPLAGVELDYFYRAINEVRPSLIRIDADEVTYNLHIILRFELEQDILERRVELRDLPEIWNERMRSYLGIEVPDDARGVLQDVHWSGGLFGYFPTYALGNLVAAQLWEKLESDIPDVDDQIASAEFRQLTDWLRQHVWKHGRKFTPVETIERAVGGSLDAKPYLRYLEAKIAALSAA
ncbi:MAG: carboxypeptidase Taq [Gaiellaceae bacterium]|jgi:carboxypeptidase Taq|nr:carboxypeptidase Taq [Gaiellaceae bacterium]